MCYNDNNSYGCVNFIFEEKPVVGRTSLLIMHYTKTPLE